VYTSDVVKAFLGRCRGQGRTAEARLRQ